MEAYEERPIYITWTYNSKNQPAMLGIFEDIDEAKAACEDGDCVQPTRLNCLFSRQECGADQFGPIWEKGKDNGSDNESCSGRKDADDLIGDDECASGCPESNSPS